MKELRVILRSDVQGTLQILERYPDAVTIFIMAPSLEILKQRLMKRGTEDLWTMEKRLRNAEEEIARKSIYRHVIVNDELSTAIEKLTRLVGKYRHNKNLTDAGARG